MTAIDPGTQSHPHRASAGPFCCFAGVSGPAMQRGGGSKLKGLTGDAPVPHADAANDDVILHDLSDTLRPLGASLCGESACHPMSTTGSWAAVRPPTGFAGRAASAAGKKNRQ